MARPRKYDDERVTTAIRLPKRIHERLRQVADERDVSVSWLLTKAADSYLEQLPAAPEPARSST
jgi:predicted transcriptional regulator